MISGLLKNNKIKVVAGHYDVTNGIVPWLVKPKATPPEPFLFVTPVRAFRAPKYQGAATQRLLAALESVSRFQVGFSENPVLKAAVQRSAI